MKLYQGLTQVQVNEEMADDAPDFKITTDLVKPLHYAPSELYHYLDAVLKPGSRHDQNNLKYVTDAAFIGENFDFNSVPFTAKLRPRWHLPEIWSVILTATLPSILIPKTLRLSFCLSINDVISTSHSSRFDWHSPIVKNNPKNTATRSHETPIRLRYFLID